MRYRTVVFAFLILAGIGAALVAQGGRGGGRGGGTRIAAEQECPPGTTETRPGSCQTPEFPPPSIVDYRPRSTLVTAEHKVPKAKFPAIDIHGHADLSSPEGITRVLSAMDALNIRVFVSADNTSGETPHADAAGGQQQPAQGSLPRARRHRFPQRRPRLGGPGREAARGRYQGRRGRRRRNLARASASPSGKRDGTRLKVDDPELDPVWQAFARLDVPVFIHTAEPQEFFQPLDYKNERWLELALFADRRNNQPGQVTFDELMTERNNVFRKHPKTRFIAAHFGWHANDLQKAAAMLDAFPNVTVEVGAILYDLGRQPRAAHDFFVKYQDRILFGKDAFQPDEYPYYWRVFETRDEYFDYYRDYHAFWKLYGMDLPDAVLKKVYYQNALRVVKGLPTTAGRSKRTGVVSGIRYQVCRALSLSSMSTYTPPRLRDTEKTKRKIQKRSSLCL